MFCVACSVVLITPVGEESAISSGIDYSYFFCFCSIEFPVHLDA